MMRTLIEALASTTLSFWEDPHVSASDTLKLLVTNAVLIVLARSVFFGFPSSAEDVLVTIIVQLVSLLMLIIATFAVLLRPDSQLPRDAYALAKLLAVAWLLALALFSFNAVPPLNIINSVDFENAWPIAFGYALLVSVALYVYTVRRVSASTPASRQGSIFFSALWVTFSTAIFLHAMVIDEETDQWLQKNAAQLVDSFNKHDIQDHK